MLYTVILNKEKRISLLHFLAPEVEINQSINESSINLMRPNSIVMAMQALLSVEARTCSPYA
jgi:hypothetical protein